MFAARQCVEAKLSAIRQSPRINCRFKPRALATDPLEYEPRKRKPSPKVVIP